MHWVIVLVAAVAFASWLLIHVWTAIRPGLFVRKVTIAFGDSSVEFEPNWDDIQIAHKLWIELSTRKLGLPFDEEHDVVVEVYDSWYEFFKITRDLLKDVPAEKIRRNASTRALVQISMRVLNEGLRPHLTQWQARFRRWYEGRLEADKEKDTAPQEIQKGYPHYTELVASLKEVNRKLVLWAADLNQLAAPDR